MGRRRRNSGDSFIWLSGGALAVSVLMVLFMLGLIVGNGLRFFWPDDVVAFSLRDGTKLLGEIALREVIPTSVKGQERFRIQVKRGNRDIYGSDFVWIDEESIQDRAKPADVVVLERLEWGNFYGYVADVIVDGRAHGPLAREVLERELSAAHDLNERIRQLVKGEIGAVNAQQEDIRLRLRSLALQGVTDGPAVRELHEQSAQLAKEYGRLETERSALTAQATSKVVVEAVTGEHQEIPLSQIVRLYAPNRLGYWGKSKLYVAKVWEFLSADPRESNTEGGVFPAIFGTVMLVMIMSIIATPLGVLAAIYLREYAKQGRIVSLVRIAVNNLAGVPSIVFGVFGVGFFIYVVGGGIDRFFFEEALPTPTFGTGGILWASLTLALLTVPTVIVATEEGLASIPKSLREGSYALGATKFETTWRVVLPSLAPSILTGMILAVARAAGEVAPLMVTGVVKLAPALPVDDVWPFIHLERKFMHLGFHIYDVGFQSPNVDAARPMVYTTTLLLLLIVVALNLFALIMRNRLRRRFMVSAV